MADTEPQDDADTDTLELGETVSDTELQPLLVREGELVADTLAQADGLTDTLGDPLLVKVPDTEPQEDADTDTLELGVMVRDTVLQPLLVCEGELVADTLAQDDGLTDALGDPLLVKVPDTEPQEDADTDTLELGVMVRDTVLQPVLVREGELVADMLAQDDGLTDALCDPLLV